MELGILTAVLLRSVPRVRNQILKKLVMLEQ